MTEPAEAFARVVLVLIELELVEANAWTDWAVKELLAREEPSGWLAELATTHDVSSALEVLRAFARPTVEERLGCTMVARRFHLPEDDELLGQALGVAGGMDTGGGFRPYQRELMDLARRRPKTPAEVEALDLATVALLAPLGVAVRERAAGRIRLPGDPREFFVHADHAFHLARLDNPDQLRVPFEGRNFPCLLWDADGAWPRTERLRLAAGLMAAGCRYVVCGGPHADDLHLVADIAFIDQELTGPAYEENFVMTTAHADESLEDTAFFFVCCTSFAQHGFDEYFVLVLGGSEELVGRLEASVRGQALGAADD